MGYSRFQAAGNGFQNPAREIPQMRGEDDLRAQMDGDFRLMTMRKHAIRLQTHFTETVRYCRLAPRTAHPAGGINYRPLRQIEKPAVNQRF